MTMIQFPAGAGMLSLCHFGAYPDSYSMDTRDSVPGKVAREWSWLLISSSFKVKNTWSYTSTPTYIMAWYLAQHKHNFTLPV